MLQEMSQDMSCESAAVPVSEIASNRVAGIEPLAVTKIRAQKSRATPSLVPITDPARVRRKSPQPFRPPSTRVGLM
jgi:hypothetical protein